MKVNLENTYWVKNTGYPSELRIDIRWVLRKKDDERTYGSLRIASHPDLPPGFLRAIFTYVTSIKNKSDGEIIQSIEDFQMKPAELEVYSVKEKIETAEDVYEAPFNELEDLFKIKIFDD